jgi:nucleoside diphosphate kinase
MQSEHDFSRDVSRLSSQPVRVFVLRGHGAIESWLTVIDATHLNRATPFLHASVSRVEAAREIEFFFGGQVR